MIKKIEVRLNESLLRRYCFNENDVEKAIADVNSFLKENGVSDCTLLSTKDFPACNAHLAEKYHDSINLDYYLTECDKYGLNNEILTAIMDGHVLSEKAIIECLRSMGEIK